MELMTIKRQNINYKLNMYLSYLGRFISELGTSICNFALSLYALDLTKSVGAFSLVLGLAIIPSVIVNIFFATFVDKYNRKKIMIISEVLSGFTTLMFFLVINLGFGSLGTIIGYVMLLSITQAFFSLALNSSISRIASEENVAKVNATLQSIGAIIRICGPIIGAIAYKAAGISLVLLIDGISFIFAGFIEFFLIFDTSRKVSEVDKELSYLENLKIVYKYLNVEKAIKILLIFGTVINLLAVPLGSVVLPFVTYNKMNVSASQLSIILSFGAVGMIAGSVYLSFQKQMNSYIKKLFLFSEILSLMALLWVVPNYVIVIDSTKWLVTGIFSLLFAVCGVFNAIIFIPLLTHFQLVVPEEIKARFFGVLNTALAVSTPIGMWLYGFFLEKLKWNYVMVFAGIIMFTICFIFKRNNDYRKFAKEL